MKELKDNQDNHLLFKVDVPLWYYAIRVCLLFVILVLYVLKIDYRIIAICLVFLVPIFFNTRFGMIDVYPQYFALKRFGLFSRNFQSEEKYYYTDMWDFDFEKGQFSTWIFLIVFFMPVNMSERYSYRLPSITFKYREADGSFEINKRFNHLSSDFAKAFGIIDEKVKSQIRPKQHHDSE